MLAEAGGRNGRLIEILNLQTLALEAQDRPEEAETLFREALAIQIATLPSGHPERRDSAEGLVALLRSQNRNAEAASLEASEGLNRQ